MRARMGKTESETKMKQNALSEHTSWRQTTADPRSQERNCDIPLLWTMQLSTAFIIVCFSCSVASAGPIAAKLMLFHARASKTTVFSLPIAVIVSKEERSKIDKRSVDSHKVPKKICLPGMWTCLPEKLSEHTIIKKTSPKQNWWWSAEEAVKMILLKWPRYDNLPVFSVVKLNEDGCFRRWCYGD